MCRTAAGDDAVAASVRGGPAVPPAVAAQGAQAFRARGRNKRDFASSGRPVYRRAKSAIQGGSYGSIIAPAPTRQKRDQQFGRRAWLHVVLRHLWAVR